VGPLVICALIVVWTFSLWTYDRQVTHRWREDREQRLDLVCQMLTSTISRSIRQDLAGLQQMLLIWLNDQEVPNEVVREEQVAAVARRHHLTHHRILMRLPGSGWLVVAGDRQGRASPEDPVLAMQALRRTIATGPIESLGPDHAKALVYAGTIENPNVEVVVEARWDITPETLIEGIDPTLRRDIEQTDWGLRDGSGQEIFKTPHDLYEQGTVVDVDASPWLVWHLALEPHSSWFAAEAKLRRTIWIIGGIAMALSVAFLLHIEFKNKILTGLANRSIETAALLETVLDGSEDHSIIATDLSGRIVRANRGTERLYGHAPARLIGRPIGMLSHPQAPATDRFDHILGLTLESRRYDDVVVVRRADGSMGHVQLTCALRTDADGHAIGFVFITHDVTALLDRTVRLEQLNAQLAEQTRIARHANQLINEFLANMSHELRTPLNAILGYTRLVQRKTQDILPPKQGDNLNRILDAGESLMRLINDLLDLSKIEAGRMPIQCETLRLPRLVSEVVQTVRPLAESQLDQIQVKSDPALPPMVSDPHHLRQIVMNLVANAIKFTSKGTISVELRPGRTPHTVQIVVSDTGIGIPEEHLPHIFEAFYQVDGSTTRAQGGTGLGLSIVQRLVQQLGGEITVDSRVGRGATFTVTLPRDVTGAPPEIAAASAPEPVAPSG
jgi:PAS domain S-box-containing protein